MTQPVDTMRPLGNEGGWAEVPPQPRVGRSRPALAVEAS